MAWRAVVLSIISVFALSVYVLVAGPTIEGIGGPVQNSEAVAQLGFGGQFETIKFVALVMVPTVIVGGLVAYMFASAVGIERFIGRRGP
jgi:hypothetical protein